MFKTGIRQSAQQSSKELSIPRSPGHKCPGKRPWFPLEKARRKSHHFFGSVPGSFLKGTWVPLCSWGPRAVNWLKSGN